MKKIGAFLMIFVPLMALGQVNENFSDGNFSDNPVWTGTTDNFTVNAAFQLQSKVAATSKSYLTTPCEAFNNAVWEAWIKINYSPTSSNYACVYIISDRADVSGECFGYYVQIGNANKEISLYVQEGAKKTKIIDGTDNRVNSNPVEVKIKVTRDADGNFALHSKFPAETDYVQEGTAKNTVVLGSKYFGLLYANSSTTGNAYLFDDISVTGEKLTDKTPPVWINLEIIGINQLKLTFSESMDFSKTVFIVDNEVGSPADKTISADATSISLTFNRDFERGKIYTVTAENGMDLSGNVLEVNQKQIGMVERVTEGDIVINEVCFDAAQNGAEYFEIFNTSGKVIDLGKLLFVTRKTDGTMNSGYYFPQRAMLLPAQYAAFTPNADSVRNACLPPTDANIISVSKWYALNNSGGNLLITNATKDTIFDEAVFNHKWHHAFIKNPKGVSLEKINPLLSGVEQNSWHSGASEVRYGTPGYKNSQFRETVAAPVAEEKWVWAEPESFSPDNDGADDVCFIRYKTDLNGAVANAAIFNALGVKVKQLAANQLLASEGFFAWDGTGDNGKILNPSLYVFYIEIIHLQKGIKKVKKLPVVVSAK